MCGYFISNDPYVDNSKAKIIEDTLRFRGPDSSSGLMYHNGWYLYHSRLAIIDVEGTHANQPYFDEAGGCLVFNGEILNYQELGSKYFNQIFDSDTEVLSRLIISDLLNLSEIDGFFSFCYIDNRGELKYCARDKFGVKPLFYYKRNQYMTVSSEPSTLKNIFSLKVNEEAINEYLLVRAPIFKGSFFQGIESLEPGRCLMNGTYFDVASELSGEYVEVPLVELDEAVSISIKSRLVSDVKVGLLLSRGIDSNLIRSKHDFASLYTIGFPGDEDLNYLNSLNLPNLAIHTSNPEEYKQHFEELLNLRQEPMSVPNEVLLSKVGLNAASEGVKVLLSGEGADEFFAGYDRVFQWASRTPKFNLDEFLIYYCYSPVNKNTAIYDSFRLIFESVVLPNAFEYVRWFFIKYHMPILFRRLDFSLMSAGIEGREPLANSHLFNVAKKMGPAQLLGDRLGKTPLRQLSIKPYGEKFAFESKVGFPVDLKAIYGDKSDSTSYDIWFRKNREILK